MWKPFTKADLSLCLKEPYEFFLVRPVANHPGRGGKCCPTVVQLIDEYIYTADNELEPLIYSHKDNSMTPCDDPFECNLEWCEIPEQIYVKVSNFNYYRYGRKLIQRAYVSYQLRSMAWIETAVRWRSKLEREGLVDTCAKLQEHIDAEKEHYARRKVASIKYYRDFTGYFNAHFVDYKLGYDSICTWLVPGTWKD